MNALKQLTYEERALLQRLQDGDLEGDARARALALLEARPIAKDFVASLEEVSVATRAAEREAWERASVPGAAEVAGQAAGASALVEQPLEALVGLLDRFHDGEATAEEIDEVELLMEAREDVAEYLLGMSELGEIFERGHEEHVASVDLGGLWGALEARLDEEDVGGAEVVSFPVKTKPTTAERPAFDLHDHQLLLCRYHDGEASEEERAQVLAWAEIDEDIANTLGALDELTLAATAAMEQAQERADLGQIWSGVVSELGDELEQGAEIIPFGAKRAEKDEAEEKERDEKARPSWRREAIVALAAAFVTILGVGVFGERIFGPRVVEKTIVIVDSVEYGDGNSVIVTGPMQQASMEVESEDQGEQVDEKEPAAPTVIWLIDPNEGPGDVEESESAPEADGAAKENEEKKSDWREKPI